MAMQIDYGKVARLLVGQADGTLKEVETARLGQSGTACLFFSKTKGFFWAYGAAWAYGTAWAYGKSST